MRVTLLISPVSHSKVPTCMKGQLDLSPPSSHDDAYQDFRAAIRILGLRSMVIKPRTTLAQIPLIIGHLRLRRLRDVAPYKQDILDRIRESLFIASKGTPGKFALVIISSCRSS